MSLTCLPSDSPAAPAPGLESDTSEDDLSEDDLSPDDLSPDDLSPDDLSDEGSGALGVVVESVESGAPSQDDATAEVDANVKRTGVPASIQVGRATHAPQPVTPGVAPGIAPTADPAMVLNWRAHDRTHLELPVPVPVPDRTVAADYVWEAYFFVPESFHLNGVTYSEDSLDADFKSYVRLAVPQTKLPELEESLVELFGIFDNRVSSDGASSAVADDEDVDSLITALRLFACRAHRVFACELDRFDDGEAVASDTAEAWSRTTCSILHRFRQLLTTVDDGGEGELAVAMRWVDEDISLNAESTLVRLAQLVEPRAEAAIVDVAVSEARYRQEAGYAAVHLGDDDRNPTSREMERLEFRRHTLKRFTASILWLDFKAQDPSKWAKQVLYALAASFAMAFAVAATLWNGLPNGSGRDVAIWLLVAVIAYAVKDRIKASLQDLFSGVLSKRFPDRRWKVSLRSGKTIGVVDERSGFAKFERLPEGVLSARRVTRQHPIEEEARPETVLWHQKTIHVDPETVPEGYAGLLEIFRVDLRRWLVNTDEPDNHLLVADPKRGCIDSVIAPRVYNIAVVYRMKNGGSLDERWRRTRVVVTRKGIRRIERIS